MMIVKIVWITHKEEAGLARVVEEWTPEGQVSSHLVYQEAVKIFLVGCDVVAYRVVGWLEKEEKIQWQ